MANVCITQWAVEGGSESLAAIKAAYENLSARTGGRERPGLADFLTLLNIRIPKGTDLAACIVDCTLPDKPGEALTMTTEEDWDPKIEAMMLLREPLNVTIYYNAEGFEDDIYLSNDTGRKHFKDAYALDFETFFAEEADPVNYFETEKQLLDFVDTTFGVKLSSADEVGTDLEEILMDMGDENAFVSLHVKSDTD